MDGLIYKPIFISSYLLSQFACSLYICRRNYFVLPIAIHFTVSDIKFSGPAKFLKKGFCSDYFLDVALHVRVG